MAKPKMPDKIFVYIVDYDGDSPLYGVSLHPDEIDESFSDNIVGVYLLKETKKLKIGKVLV